MTKINKCHWCEFQAKTPRDIKYHESFFHFAQWVVREKSRKQIVVAYYHMQRRGRTHPAAGRYRIKEV